jgi:hypothetical protein
MQLAQDFNNLLGVISNYASFVAEEVAKNCRPSASLYDLHFVFRFLIYFRPPFACEIRARRCFGAAVGCVLSRVDDQTVVPDGGLVLVGDFRSAGGIYESRPDHAGRL